MQVTMTPNAHYRVQGSMAKPNYMELSEKRRKKKIDVDKQHAGKLMAHVRDRTRSCGSSTIHNPYIRVQAVKVGHQGLYHVQRGTK